MEVTSKGDFFFLLIMKIPMYAALALLTWKLIPSNINMLSDMAVYSVYAGLAALCCIRSVQVWKVRNVSKEEVPEDSPVQIQASCGT